MCKPDIHDELLTESSTCASLLRPRIRGSNGRTYPTSTSLSRVNVEQSSRKALLLRRTSAQATGRLHQLAVTKDKSRHVSFGKVSVREHAVTVSSDSMRIKCPLTLDWKFVDLADTSCDAYSKHNRFVKTAGRMPVQERRHRVRLVQGLSEKGLQDLELDLIRQSLQMAYEQSAFSKPSEEETTNLWEPSSLAVPPTNRGDYYRQYNKTTSPVPSQGKMQSASPTSVRQSISDEKPANSFKPVELETAGTVEKIEDPKDILTRKTEEANKHRREERLRKREARRQNSMPKEPVRMEEDGDDPSTEENRRFRAHDWYLRMAMPRHSDFMEKAGQGLCHDITADDIDLLPWNSSGTKIDFKTMNSLIRESIIRQ
jgi:hypothetical protein